MSVTFDDKVLVIPPHHVQNQKNKNKIKSIYKTNLQVSAEKDI